MENIQNDMPNDVVEKSKINIKNVIIEMAIYVVISIILILLVRTFLVQHVKVSGTSMEPTLNNGQHLLIEKISYRKGDINRYDIIVFRPYPEDKDIYYIKRVYGLPGETIKIENSIIYINGKRLNESYGEDTYTDAKLAKSPIKLGADDYFVLGDNREVSKDSREKDIGLVNFDMIIGKAWCSVYPLNRIGFLK